MSQCEDFPADSLLQVFHFKRTPVMSTYLVAFVIGEFDFLEDTTETGVQVRVYTPVGKSEQGRFALEVLDVFTVFMCCFALSLTIKQRTKHDHLELLPGHSANQICTGLTSFHTFESLGSYQVDEQ